MKSVGVFEGDWIFFLCQKILARWIEGAACVKLHSYECGKDDGREFQ